VWCGVWCVEERRKKKMKNEKWKKQKRRERKERERGYTHLNKEESKREKEVAKKLKKETD